MSKALVSAVFDNQAEAEIAVSKLRSAGVKDDAISIIAQRSDEQAVTTDGSGEEVAKDVVGTAVIGAGVGTLLGIAALAIPGGWRDCKLGDPGRGIDRRRNRRGRRRPDRIAQGSRRR